MTPATAPWAAELAARKERLAAAERQKVVVERAATLRDKANRGEVAEAADDSSDPYPYTPRHDAAWWHDAEPAVAHAAARVCGPLGVI